MTGKAASSTVVFQLTMYAICANCNDEQVGWLDVASISDGYVALRREGWGPSYGSYRKSWICPKCCMVLEGANG